MKFPHIGAALRRLPPALCLLLLALRGAHPLPPSRLPRPEGAPLVLGHHEPGAGRPAALGPSLLAYASGRRPSAGGRGLADRALVLCWHSFLGDPSLPTDFSLAELGRQLDALAALGYRFPSLDELLYGRIEGRLNVVVTLDDGHRTLPLAIERVFAPRGIKPALFVYPAVLGTTSFSMDEGLLRRFAEAGLHVGAHGYHHLRVTEELRRREPAAFEREIYKAKDRAEALGGRPVLSFAYPFGAFSPSTKAELARAGYAFGFAVGPGFVYAEPSLNDPFQLPRLVVTRENWPEILALLARNAGR